MSNGWKCDKCGHYFETTRKHEVRTYEDNSPWSDRQFDLCEECKQRFDKWIESTPYLGTEYQFLVLDEEGYLSTESLPYGWPTFEDGTPIKEGDKVLDQYGHGFVVHSFCHYENWWVVSSGHGYSTRSATGVFKRPTKDQMAEYYKKWPSEREEKKQQPNYVTTIGWSPIGYATDFGLEITDDVYHPKHYDNGKVECIDWIEEMLTPEEFKGYLKGAALKYQFRCENKEDAQKDLEKAKWYISKLKERLSL